MSGNIITASNLVVAGNIAVGGFLVQGTSISQGNVNVGSITVSGYQIEVSGTTVNFSGATLTGVTVCGAPIGGWTGTAQGNLNMGGYQILNVERLTLNEQDEVRIVAPGNTKIVFTNICDGSIDNRITFSPSDNFIGIGQPAPNAGECIHAVPPVIFEGSLAVGTPTLSGALNVAGDVYVDGELSVTSLSGSLRTIVGNVVTANIASITISQGGADYAVGDVISIDANVNTMPFYNNVAQQLVVSNVDSGAVTELSLSGTAYYSNKVGCFAEVTTSALTGAGTGLILAFGVADQVPFNTAPRDSRQQPLVQNGNGVLADGQAIVKLKYLYDNAGYSVAIAPTSDNSGFWITNTQPTQFTVNAANSTGTENWGFRWSTFGIVETDD